MTQRVQLSWVLAPRDTGNATHLADTVTHDRQFGQRAVLGLFGDDAWMSVTASLLILFFVAVVGLCRCAGGAHPHGPDRADLTFSLIFAAGVDIMLGGWHEYMLDLCRFCSWSSGLAPEHIVFVKDGEVSFRSGARKTNQDSQPSCHGSGAWSGSKLN